jgi:hypothetical protein
MATNDIVLARRLTQHEDSFGRVVRCLDSLLWPCAAAATNWLDNLIHTSAESR